MLQFDVCHFDINEKLRPCGLHQFSISAHPILDQT